MVLLLFVSPNVAVHVLCVVEVLASGDVVPKIISKMAEMKLILLKLNAS